MNLRPDIKRGLVVNTLAASHALPDRVRYRILRWYGIRISSSALVLGGCFFGAPTLTIGEETFVNVGCLFDLTAPITIGSDCNVAMRVVFTTTTHEIGPASHRAIAPSAGVPIVIEDGCWIGAASTILPGVTIASGCVIAAGAVVTRSTERDGLYGGVPARRLRDLPVGVGSAASSSSPETRYMSPRCSSQPEGRRLPECGL